MAVVNGSNETQAIYGTDLVLLVQVGDDWKPVAHATTHTIDISRDTREVSSKSTGEWKNSDYAKISWSGSCDALVSFDANIINYEALVDMMIARTLVRVISVLKDPAKDFDPLDDTVAVPADSDLFLLDSPTYTGDAVITAVSLSAPEGDNATFNLSFSGASPLAVGSVAAPVIP